MKREVIITKDGSKTIFLPEMQEQYHSVNGAITESKYVFIEKGYLYHKSENPVIFEIGFGTGLNCLLTAIQAEIQKRKTIYFTVDNYRLNESVLAELEYDKLILNNNSQELYHKIHSSRWEIPQQISKYFQLCKINMDIASTNFESVAPCDIIYFDAFGPDKQPEMWTPDIFSKLYERTLSEGIFVTYSAKGEVRRQLDFAGYEVERLPGPPGKKEMLRGRKLRSII